MNPHCLSVTNDTVAITNQKDPNGRTHLSLFNLLLFTTPTHSLTAAIHLFDTATGKPHGDGQPLQHKVFSSFILSSTLFLLFHTPFPQAEIEVLGLSLAGIQQQRQLAFIDKNHDLYIATIRGFLSGSKPVLLGQ